MLLQAIAKPVENICHDCQTKSKDQQGQASPRRRWTARREVYADACVIDESDPGCWRDCTCFEGECSINDAAAAGYAMLHSNSYKRGRKYPAHREVRRGMWQPERSCASTDRAYEVGTLTETYLSEPLQLLTQKRAGSFITMPSYWTTHARARYMALLLRNRHGLLRARCHLWIAARTRVPLTLLLTLLLAVERWYEGRSVLAVLLLHLRSISLVRARGLHHVRTRAWRPSVSVGTCALLRHVWHLGLGMRRHGRVTLVLRWHETTRRVLSHHRCTSSHLRRHVRPEVRARRKAGTHLVHLSMCQQKLCWKVTAWNSLFEWGAIIICGAPGFCICLYPMFGLIP